MFYKIVLAAKSFGSMGHAVLVDERGTHAAPMAFSTLARMLPTMACWGGQPEVVMAYQDGQWRTLVAPYLD